MTFAYPFACYCIVCWAVLALGAISRGARINVWAWLMSPAIILILLFMALSARVERRRP